MASCWRAPWHSIVLEAISREIFLRNRLSSFFPQFKNYSNVPVSPLFRFEVGSRCRKHKKQTQKKKKIEGQDDDDDVVDTTTDVSGSTVIDISCSAKSF